MASDMNQNSSQSAHVNNTNDVQQVIKILPNKVKNLLGNEPTSKVCQAVVIEKVSLIKKLLLNI